MVTLGLDHEASAEVVFIWHLSYAPGAFEIFFSVGPFLTSK